MDRSRQIVRRGEHVIDQPQWNDKIWNIDCRQTETIGQCQFICCHNEVIKNWNESCWYMWAIDDSRQTNPLTLTYIHRQTHGRCIIMQTRRPTQTTSSLKDILTKNTRRYKRAIDDSRQMNPRSDITWTCIHASHCTSNPLYSLTRTHSDRLMMEPVPQHSAN